MTMQSKNVDIFGSFLTPASASEAEMVPVVPVANPAAQIESEVLNLLADSQQPVDLKTLVTKTSGSTTETMQVIEDLAKFDLIKKEETGAYTITDLGTDLKTG